MKYKIIILSILLLFPLRAEAYSKSVIDITNISMSELSEALDKGYITSQELVQLYLERIEVYNGTFNAINKINDNALEEAKKLDSERSNGKVRSKLHGIPVVVKTNIDVLGLPTTGGSINLEDNYPIEDSYVVSKLKEAGAIILGSTNMSEFAFRASDSYSSYGEVYNAFNIEYSSYGSSGGSAVAIATSMAAFAIGTDTNASVRVPAANAGLVGLRPTLELISTNGILPYDTTRDTVGILSKTVTDNALILESIIGKEYLNDSFDIGSIKIGVIDSYVDGSDNGYSVNKKTDSDIANMAKEKIELLEKNGAIIVNINELVNNYYLSIANNSMMGLSFCDGFNNYIKGTSGSIRNFQSLASKNNSFNLREYVPYCGKSDKYLEKKEDEREEFLYHIEEVMAQNDVDVILYPTVKNKNLLVSENDGLVIPGAHLGSVIGYPSITVPMGYIDEFSYGIEFMAPRYRENLLYDVAQFFENLNNLELVNSKLTPSLYEIPDYVQELKSYYELNYDNKKYSEENAQTKDYFRKYNLMNEEESKNKALELINLYKSNKYSNSSTWVIIIGLEILIILVVFKIPRGKKTCKR